MTHRRMKPQHAQRRYGVLVGKIADGEEKRSGSSPHYEIWIKAPESYRIAVNVRSVDGSDVLAHYDPNFAKPTKLNLQHLASGKEGFTALETGQHGKGLDYLRDDLFPLGSMAPVPADGQGITLSNLLDGQIERAKPTETPSSSRSASFFRTPDPTRHSTSRPSAGFTTSI